MQKVAFAPLAAIVILIAAFAMVPTAPRHYTDALTEHPLEQQKSGLMRAVEGRLRWLGVY